MIKMCKKICNDCVDNGGFSKFSRRIQYITKNEYCWSRSWGGKKKYSKRNNSVKYIFTCKGFTFSIWKMK